MTRRRTNATPVQTVESVSVTFLILPQGRLVDGKYVRMECLAPQDLGGGQQFFLLRERLRMRH